MPRPSVGLEPYRDAIAKMVADEVPYQEILSFLQAKGLKASERSLSRYIKDWGIQNRQAKARDARPELVTAIDKYFHQTFAKDEDLVVLLEADGFSCSTRQVKDIRLEKGWRRRNRDEEGKQQNWERCLQLVWEAVTEGPARRYGRSMLHSFLQTEYQFLTGLYQVQAGLKHVNAQLKKQRQYKKPKTHKKEAAFQGVDFLWSANPYSHQRYWGSCQTGVQEYPPI
jgi:hypothetical protein